MTDAPDLLADIPIHGLPPVLPHIVGGLTKCPSFGHMSGAVCGKCHMAKLKEKFGVADPRWEIESLRSRVRLLRVVVNALGWALFVFVTALLFTLIVGIPS